MSDSAAQFANCLDGAGRFRLHVFAGAGICWLVTGLAKRERARGFKAISPGILPPLGIIFGLFVAFTAAQVWNDNERANAAVDRGRARSEPSWSLPLLFRANRNRNSAPSSDATLIKP